MLPHQPERTLFPYTTLFRSRRRQEQRSTMRSVLLNAGIAWPPSSTQMGIRFKTLIKAVKCASPPQRLLPVFHQSRPQPRSEEHTSELQSLTNLVCRLLLEKK